MMKKLLALAAASTLLLTTGCGEEKKAALKLYNDYVAAINSGDYAAAYQLTDATDNPYMSEEVFEETLYTISNTYSTASKAKKGDIGWEFTVGESTVTYIIENNKLVIPELYTELELYVPTGSTCTYNGVTLSSDLISMSDDLETTYTLSNAPLAMGTLHIDTDLFGSNERIVDPEVGDYNEFTLSEDMISEIGNLIIKEINILNTELETGDTNKFVVALGKFITDDGEKRNLSEELYVNRKLSEPFVSYTGASYVVNGIEAEFTTATVVDVDVDFTATWTIGENKTGAMTTAGNFTVERIENGWKVLSINTWDFMRLNVLGG